MKLPSLVLAFACVGCSSSSEPAGATFVGTFEGAHPVAVDAIAFNKQGLLTLKLTDYAGACELEEMNNAHKQSSHYLEIYLGSSYPGQIGTFAIDKTATDGTDARYYTRDATCAGDDEGATIGSITISSITADQVVGSFDLTFATSTAATDHVTGTFRADVCGGGMVVGSGGACVP